MPSYYIKNLQYVTGPASGRSRNPRQPAGGGQVLPGFVAIPDAPVHTPNTLTTGTAFTSDQPSQKLANDTLVFAFSNVTGLTDGAQVITQYNTPVTGTVGIADVVQLNVYMQPGGFGTGGNGAIIDAFYIPTGQLVDDVFVTLSPDSGGALTTEANNVGEFDTPNPETVTASAYITPTNAYFQYWLILYPAGDVVDTISGTTLSVQGNSNMVAFAYYGDDPVESGTSSPGASAPQEYPQYCVLNGKQYPPGTVMEIEGIEKICSYVGGTNGVTWHQYYGQSGPGVPYEPAHVLPIKIKKPV